MQISTFRIFFVALFFHFSLIGFASAPETVQNEEENVDFDALSMITHHVLDAHEFHVIEWNGKHYSIPLPIILWNNGELVTFMSSEFHHDDSGKVIVEKEGKRYIKLHEKIYQLNEGDLNVKFDEEGHAENVVKPLDFSITRNVLIMWFSVILLLLIFITAAKNYKKTDKNVPSGITSFVEPLVIFVRDEIAKPMIGEHKYHKYMPFLLTVFFFIWLNNILGLIPIVNGANVSGNIAFTATLALFTFIITIFSANKNYWKHVFWMPGVPIPMKIFLAPIELIGVFVKPISLMIRLFANITAGHIIVLALMSLIFIFKSMAIAPVSVAFALFIGLIELIITAIQAYIFTILSALYIGMATEEEHH